MLIAILGTSHPLTREVVRSLMAGQDDVEVAGLVDQDEVAARALAAEFNLGYFATGHDLPRRRLDAVVVSGTAAQRPDLIEQASALASHILCPVPFGDGPSDGLASVQCCSNRGVHLHPALELRFLPALQSLKAMIEQGTLGQALSAKVQHQARKVEQRAALGRELMLQDIAQVVDLLRWLFDTDIAEMHAEVGAGLLHPDKSVEDGAVLSVVLANGAYATLDVSLSLPATYPALLDLQLETIGTGGWVRIDAYRQRIEACSAVGVTWSNWGSQPLAALLDAFIDSVRRNLPPTATEDALRAQEVALSVFQPGAVAGT